MKLSIVIPTHNRPAALTRLLNSLEGQVHSLSQLTAEILVVANFANDPAREVVEWFKTRKLPVEFWSAEKKGVNSARNLGLEKSEGEIVAYFDDDCLIKNPRHLETLLSLHEKNPDILAIGGSYCALPGSGSAASVYCQIASHWVNPPEAGEKFSWKLVGGNVSYKNYLLKNERFDESLIFGGTETEYHARLIQSGARGLVSSSLEVFHDCEMSALELARKGLLQGIGAAHRPPLKELESASRLDLKKRRYQALYEAGFSIGWQIAKQLGMKSGRKNRWLIYLWALSLFPFTFSIHLLLSSVRGSTFLFKLSDLRLFLSIRTWGALTALRLSGKYLTRLSRSLLSGHKSKGSVAAQFLSEEWQKMTAAQLPSPILIDDRANQAKSLPDLSFLKNLGLNRFLLDSSFTPSESAALFLREAQDLGFEIFDLQNLSEKTLLLSGSSEDFEVDRYFYKATQLIQNRKKVTLLSPIEAFLVSPQSPMRFLQGQRHEVNEQCPSKPKWTVIIPVRDHSEYIPLVLEHLSAQVYPQNSVEVLLVDDGSSIPLSESLPTKIHGIAWPFSLSVLRLEREYGGQMDDTYRAGIARNAGLAEARGENILFLDSDILIGPRLLEELEIALQSHDLVQCPRQMVKEGASSRIPSYSSIEPAEDVYRQSSYWEEFKRTDDWNQLSSPWKYVCTYALAAKREKILALGPFRPEFCAYGFEDVELGYRFFSTGASFHLAKSAVYHLFPKKESYTRHFDTETRRLALKESAQLFYRLHMDPSIYIELSTLMK